MRRIGFWIYDLYNFFFDARLNPLRHMPDPTVRFILMFYLSVTWTATFTLSIGQTYLFGIGSVIGHLMVLGMFFITAAIFTDAERSGHLWVSRPKVIPLENRKCKWDLEKEG
jgi:hypothetical protein